MDPLSAHSDRDRRSHAAWVALGALVLFACGLIAARWLPIVPGVLWFAAASGLCALAGVVYREGPAACALGAAVACAGGGVFAVRVHEAGGVTLDVRLAVEDPSAHGRVVTLEGVVLGMPSETEPARGAFAGFTWREPGSEMHVRVRALVGNGGERSDASGRVRVRIDTALDEVLAATGVRAGDVVRVTGMFVPVRGAMNPGEADRRLLARQSGEAGTVFVPTPRLIERVPTVRAFDGIEAGARRAVAWVRARAGAALSDAPGGGALEPGADPDRARSMLRALVLGEREGALAPVQRTFERIGIAHLLAISGFHLTVLAASFVVLLRLAGDFGRLEAWIVAGAIVVCVLVVPARAPVLRAAALAIGMVLGAGFGRRYDAAALLGWIGIGLLIWRPMDVFGLGYQLSLGLTLALVWFGTRANRMLGVGGLGAGGLGAGGLRGVVGVRTGWWRGVRGSLAGRWVTELIAATLVCWTVALPTIVVQTGVLSVGGIVATVLIVPIILPTLWLAYAAAAVGVVWPAGGAHLASVAALGAELSQGLAAGLEGLPGAWVMTPVVGVAWGAAATAWVVMLWSGRVRGRVWWAAVVAGAVVLAGWMFVEGRARGRIEGAVRVDMLAVGDGTCVLVRSGGEAMLWDCGSTWLGVGERLVPRAVRALGVRKVRTAVVSHANLDHYAGLLDAAVPLGIEEVIVSEAFMIEAEQRGSPERALVAGLEELGVRVRTASAPDAWRFGRATVRVIQSLGKEAAQTNDRSLVLTITADTDRGASAVLLVGDVEDEGIAGIRGLVRSHWESGKVEVMELPHHGSYRRSAERLVEALDPRVVLQSTGRSRLDEVRWAAARAGRAWSVTAAHGWSWAEIRRDGSVVRGSGVGAR